MSRRVKRERPKSDPIPASLSKRLRKWLPPREAAEGAPAAASSRSLVLVTGLPADCTVLELKARLEMYGPISRTLIDVDGRGYVTFRSDHSAEAAIAASLDPAFGVSIRSQKVLVVRASDPVPGKKGARISPPSKLIRAELPLSRHGRSNKKLNVGMTTESSKSSSEIPNEGRAIIAYDDLF